MNAPPNRRDFLSILAGGMAGLCVSPKVLAAERSPITAAHLSDNLIEFTGAGANVIAVSGGDGVVLVNGGLKERSEDLLKLVAAETKGQRIEALIDMDWHPEYTGSNEVLAKTGTKIVAHEFTKQYIGADIYVDWQRRTYKASPARALPTETFTASGTMKAGGERIEYAHLGQAHTDGAIYVFFPASNVLMAGDALSVGKYPVPDYTAGGWLGGLIAANKALLAVAKPDTRIVPGAGPLQTRADLQAQHDMLAALMDRFVKMMKQGLGPEEILAAAPTKEYDEKWGKPDMFVPAAYRSMWLHVRELGGIV